MCIRGAQLNTKKWVLCWRCFKHAHNFFFVGKAKANGGTSDSGMGGLAPFNKRRNRVEYGLDSNSLGQWALVASWHGSSGGWIVGYYDYLGISFVLQAA